MDYFSREEAAVAVSGVVSMGLEIVAGRVVAPEFGSTIYTWGSIIGISMLALSLGYHRGGKRSTDISGFEALGSSLRLTSVYILFVMFLGESIVTMSSSLPLGPMYAPLVPVTILFGPPTYFLGFISPYAAQLSSRESKGEASGHFYAVGTAGSILGAFGTTYLLIPNLAVNQIYLIFALMALAPTIGALKDLALPTAVALGGVLAVSTPGIAADAVYSEETSYQSLKVERSGDTTTLYLDGTPQSSKYLESNRSPWEYPKYFHFGFLMREDVEDALFIGGGGFVSPQQFASQGVDVDAVELDPGVVDASRRYFNLSEGKNLDVHVEDGREFLEDSESTYDLVVLDAFRKNTVPFHLTTQEFFELVHEKTDENGVVISNLISTSSGPGSGLARSYHRTISQVFETTYYIPTSNTSFVQNVEIIASKNQRLSKKELRARNSDYSKRNLSGEIGMIRKIDSSDSQVLTDDYAPVDRLMSPLVGRRYVVN